MRFKKIAKALLVVVNLLTALFFLLGCYARLFSPVHFWFIGLFTLATFYLFILLLLFFIVWVFAKSRWAFIFILIICLGWKPLTAIIPFRFHSSFSIQKERGCLRVMSWNVEAFEIMKCKTEPQEKEKMIALINYYNPDVACFQEMACGDSTFPVLYHLRGFADSLHFPYHLYSYSTHDDFYPYTHFGIIIFSKFPLVNRQTIQNTPFEYNDIFQYVDMVKDGDTLRVFNIHLQSYKFSVNNRQYIDSAETHYPYNFTESESVLARIKKTLIRQQAQAKLIKAEVDKSPYPVILCGDFNDVPGSYVYETIGNGLQNAFEKKGAGLSRTFTDISPTLRIDNIFTGQQFSILQYTRIKKRLSDHYPVIADIKLDE